MEVTISLIVIRLFKWLFHLDFEKEACQPIYNNLLLISLCRSGMIFYVLFLMGNQDSSLSKVARIE